MHNPALPSVIQAQFTPDELKYVVNCASFVAASHSSDLASMLRISLSLRIQQNEKGSAWCNDLIARLYKLHRTAEPDSPHDVLADEDLRQRHGLTDA